MLRTGATVEKLEGQKLTVKTDSERAGAYIARQPERCAPGDGCRRQGRPVHRLHRGRGSRRQAARERSTSCLNRCAGWAKATILGVVLRKPPWPTATSST